MHTQPPAALRRPGNHTHTLVRRAGPGDPTSGGKAGSGPLPPGFRLCPGAPRGERFPLPAAPTRPGPGGGGGTSCHPPGTRSPPALHTPASRPACASTAWPAVLHHQALTRRGEHLQKRSEADLASLCFSYCACGVLFFFFSNAQVEGLWQPCVGQVRWHHFPQQHLLPLWVTFWEFSQYFKLFSHHATCHGVL